MSASRLDILINIAVQGLERLREVGTATKEAGDKAEGAGSRFGTMAKGIAAAGAGGILAQKGFNWLNGAANDTVNLAKNTAALSRATGMETKQASGWVSMAKGRGIEVNKLNVAFTAFSRQIQGARTGSKGATDAFRQLGISQKDLASGTTDTYGALLAVSDELAAMPDGAQKTALATKLFGRQGLALLPILNQGSNAIVEQEVKMKELGLTMDKDGQKKALKLAQTQRELKQTFEGVKMTIGTAVLPTILQLTQAFANIAGKVTRVVNSSGLLKAILPALTIGLGAAAVVLKVLAVVLGLVAAAGAAAWAALGIGVIVAVIAGFVVLYKKVGWFRNAVDAAWKWIKNAAVVAWGYIKAYVLTAFTIMKTIVTIYIKTVIFYFKNILWPTAKWVFNAIKGTVLVAFTVIKTVIATAVTVAVAVFNALKAVAVPIWNVIKVAGQVAFTILQVTVGAAIGAIILLFKWLWSVAQPVFSAIGTAVQWLWQNILSPLVGFLTGVFKAAWSGVMWVVNAAKDVFSAVGNVANWVYQNVLSPLGSFLAGAFKGAWNGLQPVINTVKSAIDEVGKAFKWVWDNVLKPVGEFIAGAFKTAWEGIQSVLNTVKDAFDKIGGALDKIKSAGEGAVDFLKKLSPFQRGGVVPAGGTLALVGEGGRPELMQSPSGALALAVAPTITHLPGGTRVTPLQAGTTPAVDLSGLGGGRVIHVHVEVNGREIAQAVARDTAERQAAR